MVDHYQKTLRDNELKFGVEYTTVSNSIIRTGFTYNESPIPGINSQSKITFGYGKDIENSDHTIVHIEVHYF